MIGKTSIWLSIQTSIDKSTVAPTTVPSPTARPRAMAVEQTQFGAQRLDLTREILRGCPLVLHPKVAATSYITGSKLLQSSLISRLRARISSLRSMA